MIRRLMILNALFTLVALVACADEPKATSSLSMPHKFESVHLGMSFEELQAARPEVGRDKFSSTSVNAFETIKDDDYFTAANYEFTGGRLSKIMLSRDGTSDEIAARCSGLIDGSIMKWGEPTEKLVGIVRRHPVTGADHEYPLLTWRRSDATIVVNCITTLDIKNAPNFYTVAIIDPAMPAQKAWPADVRRDATAADFQRLLSGLAEHQATGSRLFQ